jgi:hypothetical protein
MVSPRTCAHNSESSCRYICEGPTEGIVFFAEEVAPKMEGYGPSALSLEFMLFNKYIDEILWGLHREGQVIYIDAYIFVYVALAS